VEAYGVDANHDGTQDPYNPVDAIFAAARYLKAAGADGHPQAIFAYNHADWYVDSVLMRARLIGGLPADLVGSLDRPDAGPLPGAMPEAATPTTSRRARPARRSRRATPPNPVESSKTRRAINIYAKAGSPVIAVQDGRIVKVGNNPRLGKFVMLRDAYGNTYTYGRLKKLAHTYPVPKAQSVTAGQVDKELKLGATADPKPTRARLGRQAGAHQARKGRRRVARRRGRRADRRQGAPLRQPVPPAGVQERRRGPALPQRRVDPRLLDLQVLLQRDLRPPAQRRRAARAEGRLQGHRRHDPRAHWQDRRHRDARPLRGPPGGQGRAARRSQADPRRLEAARVDRDLPRRRQEPVLRPGREEPVDRPGPADEQGDAQRRVLNSPNITVYACGRRDIEAGEIDRRVLATLEFLAASGLKPTVSALHCGHSYLTDVGQRLRALDRHRRRHRAINGIPILGHQGPARSPTSRSAAC
jgi:hypothetical protein